MTMAVGAITEAQQAEEIIDAQTTHFMGWLKSLDAVQTIRQMRDQFDQIKEAELAKALQKLEPNH